jgi:hypothetical protein
VLGAGVLGAGVLGAGVLGEGVLGAGVLGAGLLGAGVLDVWSAGGGGKKLVRCAFKYSTSLYTKINPLLPSGEGHSAVGKFPRRMPCRLLGLNLLATNWCCGSCCGAVEC